MLWMAIEHYCYQHESSSAPDRRGCTDLSRETKNVLTNDFLEALPILFPPPYSQPDPSQSSTNIFISVLSHVLQQQGGRCEDGNQNGMREAGGKLCSPSGSDSRDRPGDLLKQRATVLKQRATAVQVGGTSRPLQ